MRPEPTRLDARFAPRASSERTLRPWLLGWFGLPVLAVANGTLRVVVLQPLLGEIVARAVSTALLLAAVSGYVWWLHRRRPIRRAGRAWSIGAVWVALTLAFEFGWGSLVGGLSWSAMLADYDVTAGRTWILVPIWIACAPAAIRRLTNDRYRERARNAETGSS